MSRCVWSFELDFACRTRINVFMISPGAVHFPTLLFLDQLSGIVPAMLGETYHKGTACEAGQGTGLCRWNCSEFNP
jgi:hypothetical protein